MVTGPITVVCKVDAGALADAWADLLETQLEEVKKVILRHGYLVRNEAIRVVPVDTGRLKSSISVVTEDDGAKGFWVVVGTNVGYAIHVEYGTSDSPAQPFLRPALDSTRDRLLADLRKLLGD